MPSTFIMPSAHTPKFFGSAALLLGLVVAPLLLPQAARAQSLTLNSGDFITVSGLGTAGKIGTTVYTPPNAMTTITATSTFYAVETSGTAAFTLAAGGALTASGQNGTGLDIDGGSSPVTISGGAITASGFGGVGLYAAGSGPVDISGGTFTASGKFGYGLFARGSGPVDITGGTFTGGQGGDGLFVDGIGVIDLFGTGFSYTVNGMTTQIASGDLPSGSIAGTLDGTLLDGQALNATSFANFATIEFNVGTPPAAAVPEASTTASLGLLLTLGLGSVVIAARKKKAGAAG